jgi:serine-threonine kinase receptor-associated protein
MVRDGVSGDWVGTLEGHKGAVWSAKLDAAGCRAATGSADFTAKVWDALSGNVVATLEHGHVVKSVDLSADGRKLATGCHDKKLRVFDLERPDAQATILAHGDKVRKVLWSHDERQIVTGSEDGVLRAWDARTGAAVSEQLLGVAGTAVTDLELSPDGSTLTAACGTCVFICSGGTLAVARKHVLDFSVEAASMHPQGRSRLAVGGTDVSVRVLDADTGAQLSSHKGHHGAVHCVRFAPDGETFSSGADDATVRIWKLDDASGSPIALTQ